MDIYDIITRHDYLAKKCHLESFGDKLACFIAWQLCFFIYLLA